ncbi:MAG: type II/IV secretion system ATPase subunit [Nitrosopumilus sp.]|uniref:Flagellar protein FlaI n=1 Tax=Nitrosopumilus zosterae TaxID=718286 RepID=A0A2S2KQI9_9ARCH|nr:MULTISPECIES: type II/IV secretion system ATPase subunit [Nitrosopumilus]MCV0367738.1 type II/IV secretion system ATPase subunit [Nitrosopumilus sp.]BDQ30647.1 type II/IV secretion system ATPase subunit [Nitrosopumilus zosterae]GBH33919.1 flagellar protein FlaI [Nitrosopumilus zosterae]
MVFDISKINDAEFVQKIKEKPYLKNYLETYQAKGNPLPLFSEELKAEHKKLKEPNLIYAVGEDTFIHINPHTTSDDGYNEYVIIEPDEPDRELMEFADKVFAAKAGGLDPPIEITERFNMVDQYLSKTLVSSPNPVDYSKLGDPFTIKTLPVEANKITDLKYHFLQKRAGTGLLDPFLNDPNLEDISIIGAGNMYIIHKAFGTLKVPVFLSVDAIDELIISLSEQFGKTISHARPVVDATLPDGSRINIVFGKDISRKGTNATIRKFASTPLSIIQVLTSGVMNFTEVAYLWMMLEAGMSLFVNGETASGKTTTLMGLTAFIPANWKIVTIEDTPELTLPHNNWITEATRNTGNAASSVTMDDLLKAALRQRPNYILVGEIRGAEGNVAFAAMQTGHPVIATFHAAGMVPLIQRLSNDPINIPKTYMENLNLALFQGAVLNPEGKRVRRVLSINEILGISNEGNVMFIPVFDWDAGTDTVRFKGKGSSALFISKVLEKRGMKKKDEGKLYEELELRAKILEKMMEKKIFNYYDVFNAISHCNEVGLEEYLKELEEQ